MFFIPAFKTINEHSHLILEMNYMTLKKEREKRKDPTSYRRSFLPGSDELCIPSSTSYSTPPCIFLPPGYP